MSQYMVKVYDSFENNYSELYTSHFDNREDAIEYAIGLTKGFIDAYDDYHEADVFIKDYGMGTYQLIGYVSYAVSSWDCDGYNKIGYNSIEFEECFC